MHLFLTVLLAVALLAGAGGLSVAYAQTTRHVDAANDPSGCSSASTVSDLDGTSWDCAYPALQDALDEADANPGTDYDIWVAEGTYYPDNDNVGGDHTDDDRSESFTISRDGVALYGGFDPASGDDTFSDRDAETNVVTLSGDLKQDDAGTGTTDNAYHVLFLDGQDANNGPLTGNTVLDGVTVTAGNADGSDPLDDGGGLLCRANDSSSDECSPTVKNVTVSENSADDKGGGMYIEVGSSGTASPTITDNVFTNNDAQFGGALTSSITSGNLATIKAALTNALFSGNSASLAGGAVYIAAGDNVASPSFTDVVFSGNTAGSIGGALYNNASGGTASPTFTNVVFSGNSTAAGGAVYNRTDGNSGNLADPSFTNVTFADNSASGDGGAIYNDGGSSGSASPDITNVILWNNTADADGDNSGSGDTMYNTGSTAQPSIRHSIVEGGQSSISENDGSSTTYEASTNLDQNPQFVDAADPDGSDDEWATADDGLRLKGASFSTPSPAIDAGDNSSIPSGVTTDLLGADRTYEGDGDGTATVDMGPYEYSGTPLPVELASFEGTQTGEQGVQLTWHTASETNNAGFEVQHRAGGTDKEDTWKKVGFVASAVAGGTTSEAQTYRFTTENLRSGTHRFRLRQVDLDGTAHLSDPIAVELGMSEALRLRAPAPNPVRQQATLSFAVKDAEETTLTLYNVLGQQVATLYRGTPPAGNAQTVDVSAADLPSGTYVLRLQAGGQTRTERLTVVR